MKYIALSRDFYLSKATVEFLKDYYGLLYVYIDGETSRLGKLKPLFSWFLDTYLSKGIIPKVRGFKRYSF